MTFGCESVLKPRVELFICQYPQVLFHMAAFNNIITQSVLIAKECLDPGVGPCKWLVEPHEVHTRPLDQLVQVPVGDMLSFWNITVPLSLVLSVNLLKVHSVLLSVTDEDF